MVLQHNGTDDHLVGGRQRGGWGAPPPKKKLDGVYTFSSDDDCFVLHVACDLVVKAAACLVLKCRVGDV